jgi:hypothetical protein
LGRDAAKKEEEMAPMAMAAPDFGKNETKLEREVERRCSSS